MGTKNNEYSVDCGHKKKAIFQHVQAPTSPKTLKKMLKTAQKTAKNTPETHKNS
jgi:hypothetical protein